MAGSDLRALEALTRLSTINRELVRLAQEREDLVLAHLLERSKLIFAAFPSLRSFAWLQRQSEYDDDGPSSGISQIYLNETHPEGWDYGTFRPFARTLLEETQESAVRGLLSEVRQYVVDAFGDEVIVIKRENAWQRQPWR